MEDKTTTALGASLESAEFQTPPLRLPIPGRPGEYFKTELVISRSLEETVKIIWWDEDDYRELPHSHPWDFTSVILSGGYTDDRWTFDPAGKVWENSKVTFRAGDTNRVLQSEYHNVTDVLPGTVTRMTCGPLIDNNWGYLNPVTGVFVDPDPAYGDLVGELNPHLARPKS